jgi:hypothetical protein
MTKALYLLAATMIAAPLSAQAAPQAQPLPTDPKKSDANKLVCKTEDTIGSRLRAKKVCLTVQQWKEQAAQAREDTERMQQQANTRPSGD